MYMIPTCNYTVILLLFTMKISCSTYTLDCMWYYLSNTCVYHRRQDTTTNIIVYIPSTIVCCYKTFSHIWKVISHRFSYISWLVCSVPVLFVLKSCYFTYIYTKRIYIYIRLYTYIYVYSFFLLLCTKARNNYLLTAFQKEETTNIV